MCVHDTCSYRNSHCHPPWTKRFLRETGKCRLWLSNYNIIYDEMHTKCTWMQTHTYKHSHSLSESQSPADNISATWSGLIKTLTCIYCSVKTPLCCSTNSPHYNCTDCIWSSSTAQHKIKANRLRVYNAGESVCVFIYITVCVRAHMYASILGQIGLNITQGIVRKTAWCHCYYTVNGVDLALRISLCRGLWHVHQGWFTDPTFYIQALNCSLRIKVKQ